MKKLILLSALLFSFNGWAEDWKYNSYGKTNKSESYIDRSQIIKINDKVYYWELVNFKEEINHVMSLKKISRVDCSFPRYIVMQIDYYSKPMGENFKSSTKNGISEENIHLDVWQYPKKNSSEYLTIMYVCELEEMISRQPGGSRLLDRFKKRRQ
jgi:hypothetical protein